MPTRRKTNPDPPPLITPVSPPSVLSNLQQHSKQHQQHPRRATRQTPIPPPPIPPLASKLVPLQAQATSPPQQQKTTFLTSSSPPRQQVNGEPPPVKRGRGRPPKHNSQSESRSWPQSTTAIPLPGMASLAMSKENLRPPDLVAPDISYHVPHHHPTSVIQPGRPSSIVKPQGPGAHPPPRANTRVIPPTPAVVTPVPPPKPSTSKPVQTPTPRADRNIDKVVFGSLCFRTWYPSYYGKEVLGDTSGNAAKGSKEPAVHDAAGKAHTGKKNDQHHHNMLERLYVCPSCFKYSKELVAWWGHVRICEQQGHVPGTKVYTHPRGRRKVLVPVGDGIRGMGSAISASAKKRRGDSVRYIEETVEDEGEWSIWEVDGEKDGLFCQNLSLFAKLFLDNKSVFFDVTGFNYFLLVYTPPPPKPVDLPTSPSQTSSAIPTAHVSNPTTTSLSRPPTPQVTGFFSKEKMSWDNNNLACILVFPPWQRKGLGALLMGASYEISKREQVMGGPEKPISDLGRKGYRRYWAGEIARWLLSLDASSGPDQEVIVDVNDCSQATWIAVEDCLVTLREMGFVEDAGLGHGKPPPAVEDEEMDEATPSGDIKASATAATAETEDGKEEGDNKLVPRVRVDKDAVRRYVAAHAISLERMCDANGFVDGYAVKQTVEDDDDEDVEME